MGEINYNITNQIPTTTPNGVVEIRGMDDFPTAVGGVIPLVNNTEYWLLDTVTIGDVFQIPSGGQVGFRGFNRNVNVLTYTGSGVLFSGDTTIKGLEMVNMGVTARKFHSLTGNGIGNFFITNCEVIGFDIIGDSQDFQIDVTDSTDFIDFNDGIVFNGSDKLIINTGLFQLSASTGTSITVDGSGSTITAQILFLVQSDTGFAFNIRPIVGATQNIDSNKSIGGTFYATGTTGTTTSYVDNSVSSSAMTSAVADVGGIAQFTSTAHGLFVNEIVTHDSFATPSYNRSLVVTSASTNTYLTTAAFVAADPSGNFSTTTTQVNSTAHGLSNGNRVKLTGIVGMTEVEDNVYTVAGATEFTFTLDVDDGTDVNSTAYGSAGTDGSVYLATKLTSVHSHRKFGTGSDQGAFSGGALVSLTANKTLELYFIGTSDATNLTVGDCSFYMQRVQ